MNWIYTLTNFLIGTCLASHAALICDRFDTLNFIWSRSHCNICHNELSLLDELPIISYFWLHGKCRYCNNPIPIKLLIIEISGGFAFSKINFSQVNGLMTASLVFSILLVAICDYEQQEFYLVMLLPAICLALIKLPNLFHFYFLDYIELWPILLLLCFYVFQQKLGSGDLLIYLILALYFSPHFANLVFLIGSILLIGQFLSPKYRQQLQRPIAFVPYLFLGLVTQLILT